MFAHVAPTEAITNDDGFVNSMLNGDASTWDNIYLYGSHQSISQQFIRKSNLANALIRTLMMKRYKKNAYIFSETLSLSISGLNDTAAQKAAGSRCYHIDFRFC